MINQNEEDFIQGWRDKANEDVLTLPVCGQCDRVVYPLGETCPNCLSDDLHWRDVNTCGRVLATTRLHYSLEPRFREHLPWALASVKLDAGPVTYAKAETRMAPGDRVRLELVLDEHKPNDLPYFIAFPDGSGG